MKHATASVVATLRLLESRPHPGTPAGCRLTVVGRYPVTLAFLAAHYEASEADMENAVKWAVTAGEVTTCTCNGTCHYVATPTPAGDAIRARVSLARAERTVARLRHPSVADRTLRTAHEDLDHLAKLLRTVSITIRRGTPT